MNIFSDFYMDVTNNLHSYIGETTQNVMNAIAPTVTTLAVLYVCFYGWSMICGLINEPIMGFFQKMIRLSVVIALTTNIAIYNQYISDWLWNTPDKLAMFVVSGSISADSSATMTFLDELVTKFYHYGKLFWDKGLSFPIWAIGYLLMALIIWIFGFLLVAYAAYLLILAKMALAVLLGVGAIFVLMTMNNSTRKFFDAWIGQVLNYVFLTMLTAATISLTLSLIDSRIDTILAHKDVYEIVNVFTLIGLSGMSVLLLMQLPSMASTLGGGVALSTLGSVNWARKLAMDRITKDKKPKPPKDKDGDGGGSISKK